MNPQGQCTSLKDYLEKVTDPRHKKGQSYEWASLLLLIGLGVLSGQQSPRAIAEWAKEHGRQLLVVLRFRKQRLPSASTVYRTLRQVGSSLETQIQAYSQSMNGCDGASGVVVGADGVRRTGWALDGKTLCGAGQQGQAVHLLSIVRHESGLVLKQCQVGQKTNEIGATPALLTGLDLHGCVVTMDALLCQRKILQQILDQGGDYLVIVKDNQEQLYQAIRLLFAQPPQPSRPDDFGSVTCQERGHGRLTQRQVQVSAALQAYLDWPQAGQVLKRTCHTTYLKTGQVQEGVTFALTSLTPQQATPAHLATLRQGHWTIENRVHYVRDVTFGEDASRLHTGHAAHALAALRNALLNALRHFGWSNIACALRHFAASIPDAFAFLARPAT